MRRWEREAGREVGMSKNKCNAECVWEDQNNIHDPVWLQINLEREWFMSTTELYVVRDFEKQNKLNLALAEGKKY